MPYSRELVVYRDYSPLIYTLNYGVKREVKVRVLARLLGLFLLFVRVVFLCFLLLQ